MLWWTDDLKTGIFTIDKQHKDIFDKANEVFNLGIEEDIEEIKSVFTFLMNYATNHFFDEEQLMIDHNYEKFAEHRKQHNYFIEEVYRLYQRSNNMTEKDLNELKVLIIDWLANHINKEDRLFIQSI